MFLLVLCELILSNFLIDSFFKFQLDLCRSLDNIQIMTGKDILLLFYAFVFNWLYSSRINTIYPKYLVENVRYLKKARCRITFLIGERLRVNKWVEFQTLHVFPIKMIRNFRQVSPSRSKNYHHFKCLELINLLYLLCYNYRLLVSSFSKCVTYLSLIMCNFITI